MSAHAITRKTKRRYNEREEQMRTDMMLRRSWGRYRRRLGRHPRHYAESLAKYFYATFVPDKVDNPAPGVYVYEWHNEPINRKAEAQP